MSARLTAAERETLSDMLWMIQCSGLLRMDHESSVLCSMNWLAPAVEQILTARLAGVEEVVRRVLGEFQPISAHHADIAERVAAELGGGE